MGTINDKGGNLAAIAILASSNTLLATYTLNVHCLKFIHLADSGATPDTNEETLKDEDGTTAMSSSDLTIKSEWTIRERTKEITDFILRKLENDTILLQYNYTGIVDGNHLEEWAIVHGVRQYNRKAPGGASAVKYNSTHIPPKVAVTFSAAGLATLGTALGITFKTTGAVTIPATYGEVEITKTAV